MSIMISNNNHETITHLAMPERQIPVLIADTSNKPEGFMPSMDGSDKPMIGVRRLSPSFVQGLADPQRRREIETEYGTISEAEWKRLRKLLALVNRLNAGDWSPITTSDAEEVLKHLPAMLDKLSPAGWLRTKDQSGKLAFRSASGDVSRGMSLEIEIGRPVPRGHPAQDRSKKKEWSGVISATCKTLPFALSEAFTRGMKKTRFVVWWSNVGKKLVPGLYCLDIVTALYALAMWSIGTAGGWAICQKCEKDYPRSRVKQRYCSHRCQVAAAMKRYRKKLEIAAKAKSRITAKSKKRVGRK